MPDHVHVLVEGLRPDSDFLKWLDLWRQLTGFYEKRRTGNYLWQEGYWDYTLRDQESVPGIASPVWFHTGGIPVYTRANHRALAASDDS